MTGIAALLRAETFRVPIYQRSYAWEELEVLDFWEDLKQAIDAKEPDYFLGTLVLTPDSENGRTIIIDGQQRLATTSLLLAAVRDIYSEWEEVEAATETEKAYLSWFDRRTKDHEPRLVLNAEDDSFFRELIVNDDAPAATRDSHERISEAYAILCDRLKRDVSEHGKRAEERLLAWADYLDTQALVITVSVPTEADAFVIFETLNDRGAPLTLGDFAKEPSVHARRHEARRRQVEVDCGSCSDGSVR